MTASLVWSENGSRTSSSITNSDSSLINETSASVSLSLNRAEQWFTTLITLELPLFCVNELVSQQLRLCFKL
ncbi:hypothetical protein MAR_021635 [Mya arenaria]|uniref:Uncharacterized protein n=1 Tax=Mya arenaria TaxID=6604 RepID=A0ABY7EGI8_MYAAR|nr:hypothetical protein MAR_021635 [Mya arenaria]